MRLLVLRPGGTVRGVVVAFPWGAGDAGLLAGVVETYWAEAPPAAGYAVVGVEVYGPSLEQRAGTVMAAVAGWIEENLPAAAGDLILAGASAGGVGVFHAALAIPDRVRAIIAMPGSYERNASLDVLAGVPVRLLVGERDRRWVTRSESTVARLQAAGVEAALDILPGQGHVLAVAGEELLRWIEQQDGESDGRLPPR